MAEQLKFGDRLFLKGEKVLFDNGTTDAIIESRNGTLRIGDKDTLDHTVIISGDLTVKGTTTTVNTQETTISDPFMKITDMYEDKAGIEVDRDGVTNAQFGWNETEDRWEAFHTSSLFSSTMESTTLKTNDLTATGTSTLSYLVSPIVNITGGTINGTVIGAITRASGKFTYLDASEYVTFSKDLSVVGNVDIQGSFTTITTDGLTEGTANLYYSDELVDARIDNLFDAGYGLSATTVGPNFNISFDAKNIGNDLLDPSNLQSPRTEPKLDSVSVFDDENQNDKAQFRTLISGPNLGIVLTKDDNEIVIDTAVKINELKFDTFPGNGTKSQYPLGYSVSYDWQVLVYIDGVVQEPTTAYAMSGTTLTLSAPLANGSVMNVIKMASNTEVSVVTDADTLNAQPGSYYLDYTNFVNTPTIPTIPTNVSAFTNDSGYITSADIPTNHMVNDASNTVAGSISPSVDATHDLGTATEQWNTIYGHTVEATFADLAERYAADAPYEPGTVLVFGGEAEVTTTTMLASTKVVGIVSTDPALKMNSAAGNSDTHPYIALKGRVPCKVIGEINRGDLLVTSDKAGYAKRSLGVPMIGTVIGKAIGNNESGEGIIEVFVSMM
ncbi:hypothetical protein N8344_00990 [bacterium]|nr:hypothetical protein [bacterium]